LSEDTKQQLARELRYLRSQLSETALGEALSFFERAWRRGREVTATLDFTVRLGVDAMREDLLRHGFARSVCELYAKLITP